MNYADYYSPPAYHPPKSQLTMQGLRPGFNPYGQQGGSAVQGFGQTPFGQMQMGGAGVSHLQAPQYQPPVPPRYGALPSDAPSQMGPRPIGPPKRPQYQRPWWVPQQQWDAMQNQRDQPQALYTRQPYQNGSPYAEGGSYNPYAQMRLY